MKRLSGWLHRWRHIWSRRSAERELADEIRFHLEMETRDRLASGESAGEARRSAWRDFGGVDRVTEEVRDVRGLRWLDDARMDVRVALRAVRRSPGFAIGLVSVLALGIGANVAVFGILDRVLLRPLPYADDDRLVMLWQGVSGGRQWVSAPDARDWSERLHTFDGVAAFSPASYNVSSEGGAETVAGAEVDATFFGVLGVPAASGRTFSASEDVPGGPDVVVLSDGLWKRRFGGTREVVGATISLDGVPATVVGVMPPGFGFPAGAELWVPLRAFSAGWHENRGTDWLQVVARVSVESSAERSRLDLETVATQLAAEYPETNQDDRIEAVPLREHLFGDLRAPLLVMMAAVAFVLLMVCANVASLLLARATTRGPETALRLALGSGRGRLVRALLAETFVLTFAGGTLGMLVARAGGQALLALAPVPPTVPISAAIDARVMIFALLVALATGVLSGIAPALVGSRSSLERTLRAGAGGSREGRGTLLLRRTLVIAQITAAIVLVTGGVLLAQSLTRLLAQDTGFATAQRMTARIALTDAHYPEDVHRIAFFDRLVADLEATPGIRAVTIGNHLPLAGSGITFSFEIEGALPLPAREQPLAGLRLVGTRYFETMEIPIVAGRAFDAHDHAGAPFVVAIDETLARRHFADRNPIGTRLRVAGQWRDVIAVVGAVRHRALDAAPVPTTYLPYAQRTASTAFVIARGERAMPDAALLPNAVRQIDRAQPVFAVRPLADYIDTVSAQPRFLAFIVGAFAVAALLVAAIGVYGIVTFAVSRRTREFGIRIAMGARPGAILQSALRDGLLLLAFAIPAGTAAALALSVFLTNLLFGVRPNDPATLVLVVLLLSLVVLLASFAPARRAAAVQPMRVLRPE